MTELDHTTNNQLELLPPQRPTQPHAVAVLTQHAQAMQTAYQLAERLVNTDLVPARYRRKPEDATAAILYGAEIGLNPIQALQNVFAVNGAPAIYARTMGALLKSRGYRFRTTESCNEAVEIRGWMPGRDPDLTAPDETSRWTIDDARKAGYTSNKKYETEPRAMLYAKALAEVCRHLAPDVLLGIAYTVDELQTQHVASTRPPTRSAPITVDEILNVTHAPDDDLLDDPLDVAGSREAAPPTASQQDAPQPSAENRDPATQDFSEPIHEPPEPPTKPRRSQMFALLNELGIKERQDYLAICSHITGRPIETSDDLHQNEVNTIVKTIKSWGVDATDQVNDILNRAALAEAGQLEVDGEGL